MKDSIKICKDKGNSISPKGRIATIPIIHETIFIIFNIII